MANKYIEQQKCDTSLPPLKAQLALEETSLLSYSQVTNDIEDSEKSSTPATAPLYPDLNLSVEKAMPANDYTLETPHRSKIHPCYAKIGKEWGFLPELTIHDNCAKILTNIKNLEEDINNKGDIAPKEKERLALGQKLLADFHQLVSETFPRIGESSITKNFSFEDPGSPRKYDNSTSPTVTTSTPKDHLEQLWQKATKRFSFSKEKTIGNERLVKRIREIYQSRLEYYKQKQDESMIHIYQK